MSIKIFIYKKKTKQYTRDLINSLLDLHDITLPQYEIFIDKLKNAGHIYLPDDFNWKTYVMLNDDLKYMNEQQAMTHYEGYGYKKIENINLII